MSDTDVVVVGAGAGGLAAAWRLTTRGVRVALLESGKRYIPSRDYPQTGTDFESRAFPYDPTVDERGRPRYGFGPAQEIEEGWDAYRSWNRPMGRFVPGQRRHYQRYDHVQGVGGSTLRFQAEAHRFHPRALRMASLFGVAADWPIPYAELEPYYELAEKRIGVAAPPENPWRPRSSAPVLPAHRLSYASQRLVPAFEQVGATLIPNSLAILSRSYDGRPRCNYCNACTEGCPLGDKGSADVTFLPAALATKHLDLHTGARAVEVEVDGTGRAAGVAYRDEHGTMQRVRGRHVVLAGGAVETARLLLLSTSGRFAQGLGNNSGQVGMHLIEHLFWYSLGILPERVDAHRGVPIDGTAWNFAVPGQGPDGGAGGFRLSTAHGALGLRGPAFYAHRLVPGFGREHQRQMIETFGHAVAVLALGEWLPNDGTRVDLDPRLRDAAGLPVARITSQLEESERRLLRRMADTTRAVLTAAGAVDIAEEGSALDLFSAAHVLGTCRMGDDSDRSVADSDGFSHEVPNLAFADGSLLPTGGSGDSPALTITAMALRTADRLLARAG